MEEQIANVLTNPLAIVKFEYFREKIGVLQIEVPSKRIDVSVSQSDMVESWATHGQM